VTPARPRGPRAAAAGLLAAAAVLAGALVLLVGLAGQAAAHGPAQTLVTVAPGTPDDPDVLRLTGQVPLDRIDFAYGTDLAADPQRAVADHRDELADLVADRVSVTDADGAAWTVRVESLSADRLETWDVLRVELIAVPPAGTAPDRADLRWDVVTDEVVTHAVYVGGVGATEETELIGRLSQAAPVLRLVVDEPQPASSSLFGVGFGHFREGPDHLLFLCLVALGAARRRAGLASTARRLAALTVTFTVGHSLSLALATLGVVTLPARLVETAIAATIVVAAGSAVRPGLPARADLALTGAFGLVHGFGFAGTLTDLDLRGTDLAVPLLTFNLGLEAAQLAALVLVAVPLGVLARSAAATTVVAVAVGAVAVSWVLERALGLPNPLDPVVAAAAASPERLALLLAVLSAVVVARRPGLLPAGLRHRLRPEPAEQVTSR
jgi:hypothetical protein